MNGRFIPVGGVSTPLLSDMQFLKAIGCDCNGDAVRGVGQDFDLGDSFTDIPSGGDFEDVGSAAGGGFFCTIGNFFTSDFGSGLFKAGLGIGGAFALQQLGGGGGRRDAGGGSPAPPSGGGGGGGGQPIIIQQQPSKTDSPDWVMPAAVIGGLGLVAAIMLSRR